MVVQEEPLVNEIEIDAVSWVKSPICWRIRKVGCTGDEKL